MLPSSVQHNEEWEQTWYMRETIMIVEYISNNTSKRLTLEYKVQEVNSRMMKEMRDYKEQ